MIASGIVLAGGEKATLGGRGRSLPKGGVSSRKLSYQGPTSGPGVPRDLLVHVGGFDASGARLPLRVAMMMFSRFSAEAAVRGIGLVTTPQVGCLGQIGTQQPDTQALV
jgi:hypothetical protein